MTSDEKKSENEKPTEPMMGAITDRQLLVNVAQKVSDLSTLVKDGFESSASRDLELVQRVTAIETWKVGVETRLDQNSRRAAAPSQHDLDAAAALAEEIKNREALAKKVDTVEVKVDGIAEGMKSQNLVLGELKGVVVTWGAKWWASRNGKIVRFVAWTLFLGWAAKNNIHIQGINP